MKKMSKIKYVLAMIVVTLSGLLIAENVFADIAESDSIYQKAFYKGVLTCYDTSGSDGGLKSTITLKDFDGSALGFFEKSKENKPIVKKIGDEKQLMSCYDLLTKKTSKKLSTSTTSDFAERESRLIGANYKKSSSSETSGDDKVCYSFKYNRQTTITENFRDGEKVNMEEYYTPQLCIAKDKDGNFVTSKNDISGQYDSNYAGTVIKPVVFDGLGTSKLTLKVDHNTWGGGFGYKGETIVLSEYQNGAQIIAHIGNIIANIMGSTLENSNFHFTGADTLGTHYEYRYYAACQNFQYREDNSGVVCTSDSKYSQDFNSQPSEEATYAKISLRGNEQLSTVILNYSDNKYDYSKIKFTDDEKYRLYQDYLKSVYGVTNITCGDTTLYGVGDYKARLWWKEKAQYSEYCYFNVDSKKKDIKVNGVYNEDNTFGRVMTLDEMIFVMNGLKNTGDPGTYVDEPEPSPGTGETEQTCANSAAAESLGWILCPLLNVLSNAANDIYNNTVKPMLQIQPELFSQDDNYGTKYAWDVFQNIANIIFVIIFLFVIFSQLTGVGIDNYGIKKILPKLIIAAILVNLSYYICLICVDLSNIIGNGLQSMFDNLPLSADGMATSITIAGESGSQSFSIVPTAITGVALLGVLVTGIWAVIANPAILLSLLVSALGIVIAIFFLFILLSARQAAVIVLTVISPVAFVCYLLPNTKKLFDKYIQLGKGLLLLYPICGLLVGGGNYVSKLLLSSGFARDNGIAAAFTAMIIGVVPIFFIPSLLKSSFTVLGNLGAKISGFGERIRGGATRGIRNMEGYKRAQERGTERGTRIRAGIGRDGKEKELSGFGRFMRGGKRNMARARSQYLKDQDARQREGSLMGVGFEAAQIGQKKKADRDETENYMTLINEKTRNGEDKKALYELFDEYVMGKMPDGSIDKSKINKSGAVAIARIAGRRKDTSADFLSEKLTKNDVANQYDAKTMAAVAKEISTGENSGMYRTSAPLGFEFAAQFNKEFAEDENGNQIAGSAVYSDWRNRENVDRALSNYVTNSQELVGVKGSSLKEIAQALEDGVASEKQKVRLQDLATSAIENRNKPGAVWDSTKAEELCRISGRYNYNAATGEITLRSEFANAGQASNNSGVAEGEVFNVQGGGSGGPGGPTPTSPMTPPADSRSSVPQNIGGNSGADSVSE